MGRFAGTSGKGGGGWQTTAGSHRASTARTPKRTLVWFPRQEARALSGPAGHPVCFTGVERAGGPADGIAGAGLRCLVI